jgi:pilus assembly protein Flp/PilA
MKALVREWLKDECGQDLIEYALLASVVSLACLAGVQALTNAITNVFSTIGAQLE